MGQRRSFAWICLRLSMCAGFLPLGLAFPSPAELAAQTSGPSVGVLLLNSGGILRGHIQQVGSRYIVQISPSSEVRVPASSVAYRGRDLKDIYGQKRKALVRPEVEHHLQLAQWCLGNSLLEEAAGELAAATTLKADHPALHVLKRRLLALQTPPPRTSEPVKTEPHRLSPQQLEAFARRLPDDSVAQFTTVIQPLLINSCTAGGCHGRRTTSEFQLQQPSFGSAMTSRLTQRNLHTLMQFLDREAPEQSRLLTALRQPPHDRQRGVLRDDQFAVVRHWIRGLTATESGPPTQLPTPQNRLLLNPSDELSANAETALPKLPGSRLPARDPFDPEIFNRLHGRTPAAPDAGSEPPGDSPQPGPTPQKIPAAPRQPPGPVRLPKPSSR